MLFGKIEYLNLLPFHLFMKRFMKGSSAKISMQFYKDVPAHINKKFITRKVDAAFISSINAKKYRFVNLAIISKKKVKSVLVVPNNEYEKDKESASSNALAQLLNVHGKVLIGDKALKYALDNDDYIDLAEEWYKKYKLPFVFAQLCFHKDKKAYKRIEKNFLQQQTKIPQYILHKASKRTEIESQEILEYLKLISYKLDYKAKLGLKKFHFLTNYKL